MKIDESALKARLSEQRQEERRKMLEEEWMNEEEEENRQVQEYQVSQMLSEAHGEENDGEEEFEKLKSPAECHE